MEPLALHIHKVPSVGLGADGEAGDVRRRAEELERSGVGAAGGIGVRGFPPQAVQMYICAMLAALAARGRRGPWPRRWRGFLQAVA